MNWMWRHRFFITCALVTVLLSAVIVYKAPEVAYLYRANKILTTVISSPGKSLSDSESLRYYCPEADSYVDGTRSRVCTDGAVMHPYLITVVQENQASGRVPPTSLVFEATLPRGWRTQPLHLVVARDYEREGSFMRVQQIPSENFPVGVHVVLAHNATANLRLNYSCALPFRSCESFAEYVSVR